MRKILSRAATLSLFASLLAALGPQNAQAEPDFGAAPGSSLPTPALPPGSRGFGLDGIEPQLLPHMPGLPGLRAEPQPAPKPPEKPEAKAPLTRKQRLDDLFARLAKTSDAGEAKGIALLIQHEWLQSGSDTADLLMARALGAMGDERRDVALALLDKIVVIEPDWAEAWNRRATLRFLDDDDNGAMEDIAHVLSLEPRHFGALSGMGFILQRHGMGKPALTALRRALAIYPENEEIRKVVDQLTPEVEGRDL